MKKKYLIIAQGAIKLCKIAFLSISFFLMSAVNVNADDNHSGWFEQVSVESQHVEVIEHGTTDFKIELMQNIEENHDNLNSDVILDLEVDSPYPAEFNSIKREFCCLPVEEANVEFMQSDPGFFFSLKLKDNVKMNIARYIDQDDDDSYVNIWKDDILVVQDYMPSADLTKILISYYGERPGI